MNQRLMRLFREVVLERVQNPVVCFLAEIDSTPKLPWVEELEDEARAPRTAFVSTQSRGDAEEQLGRGGLLLWVRTRTPEREARALEIFGRHSAHDVHVHSIPAERLELAAAGDLATALLDPTAVFDEPEEVLRREDLTREQKVLILRRWEYDARELETASDEGMRGEAPDRLDRILDALRGLGG